MIETLKLTLPLEKYGIGQAKLFDRLIEEIEQGETQIIFADNQPIRLIQVARIYIFCNKKQLVESKQLIKGQGERIRNIRCISEKFKLNESAINAACRGIKEELGICINSSDLELFGKKSEEKESPSYPGLTTRYAFYDFRWDMPEEYFNPDGYVADEGDCVTYFEWK
jgi:hypothetical protein